MFVRYLKIALVIMLIFVPTCMGQDYYEILGVTRNADQKEIKKSYRNLAMKYHPDKVQEPQQKDKMEKINMAYETLSDPKKRQVYDHELTYGRSDFGYGRNKYYDDVFGRSSQRSSHFNDFGGYNNYYSGSSGGFSSPFDLKGLFLWVVQSCYDLFFTSKVQEQSFFEMQTNSQLTIGILTMGIHVLVRVMHRKIKKLIA